MRPYRIAAEMPKEPVMKKPLSKGARMWIVFALWCVAVIAMGAAYDRVQVGLGLKIALTIVGFAGSLGALATVIIIDEGKDL